jgi:hypothetical protein
MFGYPCFTYWFPSRSNPTVDSGCVPSSPFWRKISKHTTPPTIVTQSLPSFLHLSFLYSLFNYILAIMGNKVSLEEEMINLRIVSKQMNRSSKKCEKNEKAALEKLKKVRIESWYSAAAGPNRASDANYILYDSCHSHFSTLLLLCSLSRLSNRATRKVPAFTRRMLYVKKIRRYRICAWRLE